MDTNFLSELIVRKYQESTTKKKKDIKYAPRTSVRTAKRRKAVKGKKRLDCEDVAEESAKASSNFGNSYPDGDEAYIDGANDRELDRIVRNAVTEWAAIEGLEVQIK